MVEVSVLRVKNLLSDGHACLSVSDLSKAASELELRKIVTKGRGEEGIVVDLNVDGIEAVRRAAAEREPTEQLMKGL